MFAGGTRLIVDLQAVTYIDSTALASLVTMHQRAAAAGGELKLANVQTPVRVLLELTRLHLVFDLLEDVSEPALSFDLAA
jgi:anti-sigma B factor antagonist